jgi:hypothetical protein
MNLDPIDPSQRPVAQRFLEEHSADREHLIVYLSGSHAYGFPSPDSDLDLKAMHVQPTSKLLGLSPGTTTFNRLEVIEGVEIDYTSNEVANVLNGIIRGNGNYIERVLGPLTVVTSPEHEALKPIVARVVSRNAYGHYNGFARNQLEAVRAAESPTAKKILYVLRTALTGAHLLGTGQLVVDIRELLDDYGFGDARELIEIKLAGERTALAPGDADRWSGKLEEVMALLDRSRDESPLPERADDTEELESWLLEVRRSRW